MHTRPAPNPTCKALASRPINEFQGRAFAHKQRDSVVPVERRNGKKIEGSEQEIQQKMMLRNVAANPAIPGPEASVMRVKLTNAGILKYPKIFRRESPARIGSPA